MRCYVYWKFKTVKSGNILIEVKTYTVKALINTQAFIRIITYHRERGGHLLEASQLTF